MKNVKQIWQETAKRLEKVYDRREAENVSFLLLEDLFEVSKSDILIGSDKPVAEDQLEECVIRLLEFEPVQYVTGIVDFYGRKFRIQSGALIPRPETEELAALIIRDNQSKNPKILDVGVGSGCIAITLALELKGEVFGTDVSTEALEIAASNAKNLGAEVKFMLHDILTMELPEKDLDILVSNPPYIPHSDKGEMRGNVLDHEPELALFVPDDDPLIFYRRIAEEGMKSLKSGGKIYFEIHERFGEEIRKLLENYNYDHIRIYQDMNGKDRMVCAKKT